MMFKLALCLFVDVNRVAGPMAAFLLLALSLWAAILIDTAAFSYATLPSCSCATLHLTSNTSLHYKGTGIEFLQDLIPL